MSKRTVSKAAALLLAVLMLVGAFAGCGTQAAVKTDSAAAQTNELGSGAKTVTFKAVHEDGTTNTFVLHTDAATLGEALLAEGLIEGSESQYGLFVTTVDGETADDANQEWWCLTKGGEEWMYGVDSTEISDGDTFEFTLTVGY